LTKLGDWAFQHCQKLVDVKNESSLEIVADSKNTSNGYVGVYAKEIHNGDSKIVEQDGFLFYTFDGKNYLMGYADMKNTELTLPEDFGGKGYIIYKYAFSFRPNLQKVTISAGATAINSNAFNTCDNFAELTVGKSITTISQNAVNVCPAFNKLIFLGTEAEFSDINISATNALIHNAQKVYN
jgi:hypothetical protein